jgi:hypothetical protein
VVVPFFIKEQAVVEIEALLVNLYQPLHSYTPVTGIVILVGLLLDHIDPPLRSYIVDLLLVVVKLIAVSVVVTVVVGSAVIK